MATDWVVEDNIISAYNYAIKVYGISKGGITVNKIKRQVKLKQEQSAMSEREASEYIKRQYRGEYQKWYKKLIEV